MMNGKQVIKKDDWRTPDWLFDQLDRRFYFTYDAASTIENNKVHDSNTYPRDSLNLFWSNERVFCNPPFSEKDKWIIKAHDEVLNRDCPLVVMILPMCLDTKVFNKYIHGIFHWEHLPYRVSFLNEHNEPISGNPSGTIVVYFWKPIKRGFRNDENV